MSYTSLDKAHLLKQKIAFKQEEIKVLQSQLLKESNEPLDLLLLQTGFSQHYLLTEWIDYLSDSVLISDTEGNYVYVNDTASQKTGYSKEELLTMNVRDLEVKFTKDYEWNERLEYLKSQKVAIVEALTQRKDNTFFPTEVKARYAEIDGKGYIIVIFQDISEKKERENMLLRSEAILKGIMANNSEAIFLIDNKTNLITDCNDQAIRLFETENKEELIGSDSYTLLNNKPENEVIRDISADLIKKGEWKSEFEYQTKRGKVFWGAFFISVIKIDNDDTCLLARIADIDLKKKAEVELIKSEKRFKDLVKYNQALICTHDMKGNILSLNPAAVQSVDYEEHELMGKNLSFLFDPKNIPGYEKYLKEITETGISSGIMQVVSKKGQKMYWLYHNYKVHEDNYEYIVGSAQDITERMLIQKEVVKAKNLAEMSLKARELFLANVSHEIRTPLHGILGVTNLLLKNINNDESKKLISIIRNSADNLMVIINDILDVAKMESGKIELEQIPFDFCEIVTSSLEPLRIKALEKGLEFITDFSDFNCPVIFGDPYRLSQVLVNLTNNAIKFTKSGSVRVKCRILNIDVKEIEVDISIEDTGIGIDPDKFSLIFEEFTQTESSHARIYGGTGLGLSICKNIVSLYQGKMHVKSTVNKGSTVGFTAFFPISDQNHNIVNQQIEYDYDKLQNLKILLAEDNIINQMIAKTVLEQKGAIVVVAENGKIALEKFGEGYFDLILMDIEMPDMDGEKATKQIRLFHDKTKAQVPIIALTANAMKGSNEKYINIGMDNYISKPFTKEELFIKIAQTLKFRAIQ